VKEELKKLDIDPYRLSVAVLEKKVRLALAEVAKDTAWACDEDAALQGLHGAARYARQQVVQRVHAIHDRAVEEGKARKIAEAFAHTLFARKRKTARWPLGFVRMAGGTRTAGVGAVRED
jgi:hypothetical protein